MNSAEGHHEEPIEARRERVLPILEESLRIFASEEPLEKGCVHVTRRREQGVETINDLVVCGINDDGPEFCIIEADGGPSASATILWSELLDVQKSL